MVTPIDETEGQRLAHLCRWQFVSDLVRANFERMERMEPDPHLIWFYEEPEPVEIDNQLFKPESKPVTRPVTISRKAPSSNGMLQFRRRVEQRLAIAG